MSKKHPIQCVIDDADYVALARAKTLVRRLFGLDGMPSNSQVIGWLIRSIPWDECEAEASRRETRADLELANKADQIMLKLAAGTGGGVS